MTKVKYLVNLKKNNLAETVNESFTQNNEPLPPDPSETNNVPMFNASNWNGPNTYKN